MTHTDLRLLSWNVAGRVKRQPEQASFLDGPAWDVVCLQEVTPTTLRPWRLALGNLGLECVRSTLDGWLPGEPPPDGRRLGVLTATRWDSEALPAPHPPWAERLLSLRVLAGTPFDLHNLHSPISQKPDRVKLRTHRALRAGMAHRSGSPQLAVGDFNTPRRENPDGSVWSFARDSRGRLRTGRGQEWEDAELAVLGGIEEAGVRDLYRDLHGYDRHEISWNYPRRSGGYRLDHLVGSADFKATACEYLHAARETGLSDHSPLVAELAIT